MGFKRERSRLLFFAIGAFLFVGLVVINADAKQKLVLASTTSTLDSGLFDVLIPPFEKRYNCEVKVIAVGTGQAIRVGSDGNADVLLVHSREAEEKFVADGYGVKRMDVMHNDFFVIGPKNDLAGIKGITVLNAFRKISETKSLFVSRGDDSGTNKEELKIWKEINIKPSGSWYIESGSGMEATIRIANEKVAYTLCDRGTWLSHKKEADILDILVEGDSNLFNPYSVIVVSPSKYPWVKYDLAKKFADFIRGFEGQQIIKNYGIDKFGEPLFFPDVVK
ncbi:MAG: substrate-binding domain-containing protein [Elusimicrobiota bacterium]